MRDGLVIIVEIEMAEAWPLFRSVLHMKFDRILSPVRFLCASVIIQYSPSSSILQFVQDTPCDLQGKLRSALDNSSQASPLIAPHSKYSSELNYYQFITITRNLNSENDKSR